MVSLGEIKPMVMNSYVIISLLLVVFFYFIFKSKIKIKAENQKGVATTFVNFISKRKMEIFTNHMDHSIWKLETEVSLLIIEAKKMDLFPLEILQKLAQYSNIDMYIEIENEIAKNEILELEKYFVDFLKK